MTSVKEKKPKSVGCLSREELVELAGVTSEDADNMDKQQLLELAIQLFPDRTPIRRCETSRPKSVGCLNRQELQHECEHSSRWRSRWSNLFQ